MKIDQNGMQKGKKRQPHIVDGPFILFLGMFRSIFGLKQSGFDIIDVIEERMRMWSMDQLQIDSFNKLPARMALKPQHRFLALYLEAAVHFSEYPILQTWQRDIEGLLQNLQHEPSDSFLQLADCVFETLLQGRMPTKQLIQMAFSDYIDTIFYAIEPYLDETIQPATEDIHIVNDMSEQINALELDDQFQPYQLTLEETIEEAIESERLLTTFSNQYYMVRNTVSSNKSFSEAEDGVFRSDMLDQKGALAGKAELRLDSEPLNISNDDETKLWLNLVESTINAFDELTADLLDIISHMWLVQEKDEDGYITFHSDEVLKLRHETQDGKQLVIRERDRFKIMKRVAALSSIWISMRENKVKVVNRQQMQEEEDYDFTTFHRMFDINSMTVAYDKHTGEPKGIYELKIKPAPILRSYFDATLQTLVPLNLKIIHYSYNKQRELKRLGRYLNYQWKIRTLSRTLHQPFKVKTLLEAIDISQSNNGVAIREKLEQILDQLVEDGVVAEWHYKESIDESRVGKRDWVRKYWGELSIMIIPPQETVDLNKQKSQLIPEMMTKHRSKRIIEVPVVEDVAHVHVDEPMSPESVSKLLTKRDVSVRAASAEIGISHNTLSRYINNTGTRSNKKVLEKLNIWYDEYNEIKD